MHQTEYQKKTVSMINRKIKSTGVDTNLISDGYHTFGELYQHRIALFLLASKTLIETGRLDSEDAFKSRKHHDGSEYPGWFIAGFDAPGGQVSYHLPNSAWENCKLKERELAPEWDGHSSQDVLDRLQLMLKW